MKVITTKVLGIERVLFIAETKTDVVQCGLLVREHGWDLAGAGAMVPRRMVNERMDDWRSIALAIRSSNDAAQALQAAQARTLQ